MIFAHCKWCFQNKQAVSTAQFWCAPKLETSAMCIEEFQGSTVHDQTENLGAYIHQHDSSHCVWIREIAALGYRYTLAAMPLFVISITNEEVVDVVIGMLEVGGGHGFECFRRNSSKSRCFDIFCFFDCFTKFFPGDWIIEFPQGTTLGDLGKEGGASGTLGIEHLVEAGGEYGHVLICIGSTGAVGETHCHRGLLLVMGRLTFR